MGNKLFVILLKCFTFLMLFVLIVTSCKKDVATSSTSNNTTYWQTNSQPSNASTYSGMLDITQSINFTNRPYTYGVSNQLSAYFSNKPTYYQDPSIYLAVDSVSANNTRLNFNQDYYSTTTQSIFVPVSWRVTSHNGFIASLIYNNPDSMPRYTGYLNLPDTIFLNKPLTLNLTGLYNMDSLTLTVYIGVVNNIAPQSVFIPKNSHTGSVTFPQSMVSWLTSSQYGFIYLSAKKTNTRNFLGKNYTFTTTMNFQKNNIVVQ